METSSLYYSLCVATLVMYFVLRRHAVANSKNEASAKLPPGPRNLPIIGSLHHLFGLAVPPRAMLELSRRHGPVMLLRLGEVPAVIVSSPEAAAEVTKANDLAFATRPGGAAIDAASCGGKGVVFSPYGEHWRQLRKLCITELLSARQVKRLESIRDAEAALLVKAIASSATGVVNLTETMPALVNNIVARVVFGADCTHKEACLRELDRITTLVGGFSLVDLFPSSRLVRWLSTVERDARSCHARFQRLLDDIIQERKEKPRAPADAGDEDLLDVLLRVQREGSLTFPLTTEIIGVLISDIIRAATDTTSTTLEWTMSELIKNPDVMERAKKEVRQVLGRARTIVTSADLSELHYLRMVIKEVLRLHPAGPLLLRMCLESCQIMGYDIPKGTTVFVNAYAVARDPNSWNEPEEFKPERFKNNDKDYYKGTNLDFVPFGAGRRQCPGSLFATATIELTMANLLYYFEWELPGGAHPATLDMKETLGVTLQRRSDLHLQATSAAYGSC